MLAMRKDRLFRVGLVGETGVVGTTVIVAIMVVFVCRTMKKCCPRRGLSISLDPNNVERE